MTPFWGGNNLNKWCAEPARCWEEHIMEWLYCKRKCLGWVDVYVSESRNSSDSRFSCLKTVMLFAFTQSICFYGWNDVEKSKRGIFCITYLLDLCGLSVVQFLPSPQSFKHLVLHLSPCVRRKWSELANYNVGRGFGIWICRKRVGATLNSNVKYSTTTL